MRVCLPSVARFTALCLPVCALFLPACDDGSSQPAAPQRTYEQRQMDAATESARQHLDQFIEAFENREDRQLNFMVRKVYETEFGSKRPVWILIDQYENDTFHGLIDVPPEDMPSLQSGQATTVHRDAVTDWMYTDDGAIVGGWTLRVAIEQADPGRRDLIMEAFGLTEQDLRRSPHLEPDAADPQAAGTDTP